MQFVCGARQQAVRLHESIHQFLQLRQIGDLSRTDFIAGLIRADLF